MRQTTINLLERTYEGDQVDVEIVDLSQANFDDLFDWSGEAQGRDAGCKYCLYWEQPDSAEWPDTLAGRADAKRQWFRDVEAEFGPCGKLAYAGPMESRVSPECGADTRDSSGRLSRVARLRSDTECHAGSLGRSLRKMGLSLYDTNLVKLVGYSQFGSPKYLPNVGAYACAPPSQEAMFVSCLLVAADERNQGVGSALLSAVVRDVRMRGAPAVETFAGKGSRSNCSGPLGFWLKHGFRIVREDEDFALVRCELR